VTGTLVAILLAAAPVAAPVDGPVPAIAAAVDTAATTVGGRVVLTLDVDVPEGWFVTPAEPEAELGPFRARAFRETERTGAHRRFEVVLVALEAGEVEVPPVTMRATRGDDPEGIEIASPPVPVSVASNLGAEEEAAQPDPADLKPPLVAPRDWRPVWIAAIAAALAAVAGFFLLRWLRTRRRSARPATPEVPREPARPSWEIAMEELDAIVAADWVDRGELGRQYEEVTVTVRRYLENRYGVPALESTTDDLRELLRGSPVPGPVASRVLSLLGEADLVKFARGIPDPADARSAEPRARSLVEDTMPVPREREEAA